MTSSPSNPSDANLQKRLSELESLILDKDRELNFYREEMVRLNSRIENLIEQIGHELKLAHLIQKAMVPTEIPNIPGFEFSTKFVPSYESGGDYFDIFELEDRFRFGLLVSSSSGFGLSSLFLSVTLKTLGGLEARRGATANLVMDLITNEMVPTIQNSKESAAVFYGVVDRRSFELSYCLLGDQPAYIMSLSGDRFERLVPTGPALSKAYSGKATAHTVSLNPRDRIVLATEGFSQARNEKSELFGRERVETVIRDTKKMSPHEARNEIHYQVQRFQGAAPLARDVTVVVADVKDRILKLTRK